MDKGTKEIKTGRHGEDGILQLSHFTPGLIVMSLRSISERSHTLLLNRESVLALRDALSEFAARLEAGPGHVAGDDVAGNEGAADSARGGRVGDVEEAGETTAADTISGPDDTRPVGSGTMVNVAPQDDAAKRDD